MTTPLIISQPVDVLAYVPILLGFQPENSWVMIVTAAAGRQFHARVDLPGSTAEPEFGAGVDDLERVAAREGVTQAILVVYTEDRDLANEVTEYVTDQLRSNQGVRFYDVIHATATHFFAASTPSATLDGTPYDITTHAAVAEAVAEGRVVLRTLDEIEHDLHGPDATKEVWRAFREYVALYQQINLLGEGGLKEYLREQALWVRDTLRTHAEQQTLPDDTEVGRLACLLVPKQIRDVAWSLLTRETGEAYRELFRDLTRRVPEPTAAAPASLFAFACWMAGDGASARLGVERAFEVEPGYGMAELLRLALAANIPPHTWQPINEDELSILQP